MGNKRIVENEKLKETLAELKKMGYKYIIKANDKFLSGWGRSGKNGHIQLIACRREQKQTILEDLKKDYTFNYINFYSIDDYKGIYNTTKNKSFTIRNDWTRCFKDLKGVL